LVSVSLLLIPNMSCASGVDTSPPIITDVKILIVGETWFTIEWRTDEPAIGGVEIGLTRAYGRSVNETGSMVTEHSLNVTGLTRDTNYEFRVFSRDAANNTGYSVRQSVGTYPMGRKDGSQYVLALFIAIPIALALVLVLFYERRKRQAP
jgi:hypothetical protein